MPASLLAEIVFRGLFEVVFYGVGYFIGWLVVPAFTFGRFEVEPWDIKSRKRAKRSPVPGLVSADAACAIGFLTLACFAAMVYFAWRAAGV